MSATDPPEFQCVARASASGVHLATAESCTGGLIGDRLTNVPGASKVYLGGVVAYSNDVKRRVLGVPDTVLDRHGAVSEETARAMALGAARVFGADAAVGVTGIAGPGGGTPGKPVGLVCIAACGGGRVVVARFQFDGDRASVKAQSARAALAMLLEVLPE